MIATSELEAVLDEICAKAEARKHDIFIDGDWERITSKDWARIVKLMNICSACKDVMRLWKECELDEAS